MLSFHALCRSRNQLVCDFGELGRIRQIVDHECGDRFRVVQRYISALLNRGTHIQAIRLQAGQKFFPMQLRCYHDSGIPALENCSNKASVSIQ
jgi:hypothetical protein